MKLRSVMIAALLAISLAGPLSGQTSDITGDVLQKMERQWAAAAVKGDAGPLQAMTVEDWTLTNPVGQIVPKSVLVEKIKDGSLKIESLDYANMKVRTYGDTGIVTGRMTIKASWDGSDVGGEYAFTDTFVKQAGKWQEVASQVTRIEG